MATKFDYAGTIHDAEELIAYFGMDAVLRRDGIADRPCKVAIFYNPRDKATELANPTDRQVFMSAEGIDVPPDNELDQLVTFVQPPTNPPVELEVLPFTCPVKPTAPAGVTVLYEFTVRR
jgi:hypothetical protein